MTAEAVGFRCPECESQFSHYYGTTVMDGIPVYHLSCMKCGIPYDSQ